MSRRVAAVAALAAAALTVPGAVPAVAAPAGVAPAGVAPAVGRVAPAPAGGDLTASVAEVTPERLRIVADVPRTADGKLPPLTVARDGFALPVSVAPGAPEALADGPRTVVVVVDTGLAGARLRAVRDAVLALVAALPTDVAVGLVAAGAEPAVAATPTTDRAAVRAAVDGLPASDGTALYDALRAAVAVGGPDADRRLVVVAGGRDDDTAAASAAATAVTAAADRVDLVRIGPADDGLGQLRRLATSSGGTVRVAGVSALPAALGAVAATVPARVTLTVAVPPELGGTSTTLTVTAGTGATRVSAALPVRFAAVPRPADGDPTRGALSLPSLGPVPLGLLVFAALLLASLLVVLGLSGSVSRSRLKQVDRFRLGGGGASPDDRSVPPQPEGHVARPLLALSDRLVRSGGAEERIGRDLERAGLTMRPREWMAWRTGTALGGTVLLGLLGGVLGALLGALLGWLATSLYRRLRESRRRRTFAEQLPDALQLIVGSLRSGFALSQAIDGVVRDFPAGPLTVEFGRALAEVRLGSDLDDALERAARRVDNNDLAWAVMAIRIQRDTGGNLAEVLATTVETLRERDRLRRHVRALSAEGRLSAYVLIALPFVMAGWMLLVRREYIEPLWTTPVGLVMLIGAAVLMVVGTVWMSRWVKVEV
ncbi:type II secretion system F family protein [Micromonospora endolithica]|uniref:type II secretion system F family protein n=1 Tax=Micromonospora endolithica TaxID=230091 RepID=UPI0011BFE3C0|nr:type II secretion system F family protein [Micromonospora endolithica]